MSKDPLSLQAVAYGVSMLKTVRAGNAWQPDAFDTLLVALEERSMPVRHAEVLRALEYQQVVHGLTLYLTKNPDTNNKVRLAARIGQDLLALTGNRPGPQTGDYERVSEILRSCLNDVRGLPRS
ncbi:MAG: hypothetical protein KA066_00580 [Candidatus Pacebacteria bacterium]|nr:hypothetical protein [Candidatus Paceibacterota bacterium]